MPSGEKRSEPTRFILLYALAWAGGTIAYSPLLTILLPVRIAERAGEAQGVEWLASIALIGAIAASLGNILFGYLSDVTRNRRGWIAAGLLLSTLLLGAIDRASTLPALMTAIALWQLALNMMLAPLAAWAGDRVPDSRKGTLGGLMAFAPVMGALAGVLVTQPGLAWPEIRLWIVAALVAICVVPALLTRSAAPLAGPGQRADMIGAGVRARGAIPAMWLARLAVQIAEATLFSYLFFWLRSVDARLPDHDAARLFGLVMLGSAPLAIFVGRWSDQRDRPIAPLAACALVSALGLLAMAAAPSLMLATLAYAVFGLASAVFLALHSAQTLRVLPDPARRGRDLGLFNLANTIPSLIMPWLAVTLVPAFGFAGLFACLAALSTLASVLLFTAARRA